MPTPKLDLLLHPIRMRIVSQLVGGRVLTTGELISYLPDVPQATLYRQIQKLVHAELLIVEKTTKIRGAIEKSYRLAEGGEQIPEDTIRNWTPDQHMEMFSQFTGKLLEQFASYVRHPGCNPLQDGLLVRQVPLWMDDEELAQFTAGLRELFQPLVSRKPTTERRLRTFSLIMIPQWINQSHDGGDPDEQ